MTKNRVLIIFVVAWFALHAAYLVSRGLPQMIEEWKKFGYIGSDLYKRDASYPGWAELVSVVREKVPVGSTLLFVTGLAKSPEAYFSYLLNYEIYPQRHDGLSGYQAGKRPRFILAFMGLPKGMQLEQYRRIYRGRSFVLLEKQP